MGYFYLEAMSQNPALQIRRSGRADWTRCSQTKQQGKLRVTSLSSASRTVSILLKNRFYNLPSSKKKREMRRSRGVRSSNSNSFHSCATASFPNTFNNANPTTNFDRVNSESSANKRAEILTWLSPLEPRIRHNYIRDHRVEHVGAWLLQTEEYRNWFDVHSGDPDGSVLFCYGDPGAGKTYVR